MKIPPRITLLNGIRIICVLVFIFAPLLDALVPKDAHASGIANRSLTLESVTTTGGSKPGGTVNHVFDFVVPDATGNLGSVKFEYCDKAGTTTAFPNCTRPAGVDTTAVGVNTTGFTGATAWNSAVAINTDPVNTAVKNGVLISKTTQATGLATNLDIRVRLTSIVNPTATNTTFFVWITTYDNVVVAGAPTGAIQDQGTVNASTANQIQLNGKMPESLIFCTGDVIPLTTGASPQPDCPNATNNIVYFNKLFDPTDTASATSQMAASTNAGRGYAITAYGATLANGSNTIAPITGATALASTHNTAQFGLNLVQNTYVSGDDVANVGANPSATSNGTNLKANASTNYNTSERFLFNSGDQVAASDFGGTAGPSDIQLYTVSYIVNVPGSQPAGTYTSTMTYVCTAFF